MASNYWRELYDSRRDWAFAAHEDFMAKVDPSLKHSAARGKHVTVVLYGTTQVGKTTLILHLLGVAEPHVERVADLLRGGRAKGHSSTATPLRYRRSNDAAWHIGGQDSPGLDDHAACKYFETLRQVVEQGQGSTTSETSDVVDVFLPSTNFDDAGVEEEGIDLRIIDIPGLGAENANEREHVSVLARRYVLQADLIILAGHGDSLGFLASSNLGLDELSDWQSTPYRFCIVCTRAVTVNLLRPETHLPVDAVRDYMVEQIKTHDVRVPPEMKARLHALEIGQSWREIERTNPSLHAQAKPLIDASMRELKDRIREAANPWFRLKFAYELPRIVNHKYQAGRKERLENLRELRGAVACAIEQREKACGHVDTLRKRVMVMELKLARLNSILKRGRVSSIAEMARLEAFLPQFPAGKKTVQALRNHVDEASKRLREFQEQLTSKSTALQRVLPDGVGMPVLAPPPSAEAFVSLISRLDGYWFDDYWLDSSWDKDIELLRACYVSARDRFAKRTCETIEMHLEQARKRVNEEVEKLRRLMRALHERVKRRERTLGEKELARDWARTELCDFRAEMRKRIAHGEQFMEYMQKSFEVERSRRRESIRETLNPSRRLQQNLMLPFLEAEYEGMKTGVTA